MKQKSMRLGSTLTRTESKLVGGSYKVTSCQKDSDCRDACVNAMNVCPDKHSFDDCYLCFINLQCVYRTTDRKGGHDTNNC